MNENTSTRTLPLAALTPHPMNSNVVPDDQLTKLRDHIARAGRYPPIIVRPHAGAYQILDGHHRARVLGELGHTTARCDIWEVDDDEALVLLGTLNRLRGADDIVRRAALVDALAERLTADRLTRLLPESRDELDALLDAAAPPAPPAPPPPRADMPTSLTFFMSDRERAAVLDALRAYEPDRGRALLRALGITQPAKEDDSCAC
jgi:ParB-like chromosome segregation protein Spo0J